MFLSQINLTRVTFSLYLKKSTHTEHKTTSRGINTCVKRTIARSIFVFSWPGWAHKETMYYFEHFVVCRMLLGDFFYTGVLNFHKSLNFFFICFYAKSFCARRHERARRRRRKLSLSLSLFLSIIIIINTATTFSSSSSLLLLSCACAKERCVFFSRRRRRVAWWLPRRRILLPLVLLLLFARAFLWDRRRMRRRRRLQVIVRLLLIRVLHSSPSELRDRCRL